jgi:tripartite-type tricarboxylate transporter receptor subunit TctC
MRAIFVIAIVVGLAAHSVAVKAQSYPNRPLRIIVPFPPGGGVDINNRILTSRLNEVLGQQIVIDNRAGAGGNVGAGLAAKATPDGYTLFACGVASHGVSPAIYRKLAYDAEKDLIGVAMIGSTPNVLVVHPGVPAKTVAEYVSWARAGGGKINYASPGLGTSPHMTMELFKMATGIVMNHVAYKGGAPALQEIMGGHVPSMFGNLGEQIGAIRAGKTRALAVSSLKRNAALPDVPTVAESGFPGFEVTSWYATCAPAGVSASIMDQLNAAIGKVLVMPDIRERYAQIATDTSVLTRQEFATYIQNEIAKWRKVAKAANIYVD